MSALVERLDVLRSVFRGERALHVLALRNVRGLLVCTLVSLLGLALLVVATLTTGLEPGLLTRDPADINHTKPYLGFISMLGLMLWSASAAVAFFGASRLTSAAGRERRRFLLASGGIVLLLLLDDAFMGHEWLFPTVLHVREYQVYLVYITLILAWLVRFAPLLLRTDYPYLVVALGLFTGSMGIDKLMGFNNYEAAVEDVLKLSALVFWLRYYVGVAGDGVVDREPPLA